MEEEDKLKIITLGRFKVAKGDRVISKEAGNYHKLWKLFKYLITKKENSPNIEVIMETLWPEQHVNV
ncbi:MAG: hypothetical protein ACOCP5_02990 [Halanaerobiaceae bacterium]